LVGKVEAGIPEDDPRNAAVIADNVGDNVGDCAGMAADVFESYEVTLVAAILLGAATLLEPAFRARFPTEAAAQAFALKLVIFPLLVRAVGVFASVVGTWVVRGSEGGVGDPMQPISRGFWTAAGLATVGFGVVAWWYLGDRRYFLATFTGILLAVGIERITDYYTHTDRAPVSEIAYSSKTGSATLLLTGMGLGMESSVWSVVAIGATILSSFAIFGGDPALSAYGIALAGLGLLTTTGFILAEDTYGPIVDNANGIFEMSGVERGDSPAGRVVARLDQVGNTTKALTKGFAIATAVVAATALFRSYLGEAQLFASPSELSQALRSGTEALAQVGFSLGASALGGYLAGAILTAQLLAVFMANTGGAWDNAKKKIEDGYLGGKGTDPHKAAVVGDTVGDPLKDTAGPALNPIIKVMNLVAILLAPVIIRPVPLWAEVTVSAGAVAGIAAAVWMSKRGTLVESRKPGVAAAPVR
jgi:Na+/H+-translocating membrane pyrophosphatase